MLTSFKPGQTVWVIGDRPQLPKSKATVLKICKESILVKFENAWAEELYCDIEDLSHHCHPWETNDGVSYNSDDNTFCRRIRSKGEETLIERYDPKFNITSQVWVRTELFLNYQSA